MNSHSQVNSETQKALHFLKELSLFEGLSADILADVAGRLQYRTFGNGMTLFHQEMPGMTLYMMADGYVRLYSIAHTGQEFTYYICGPGEIFGELSLLDDGYHAATCITMTPIATWLLSKDHLFEILQKYPQIHIPLLRIIAGRVRSTTRKAEVMAFQDVQGRLAYELLNLAKKNREKTGEGILIDIPFSQIDLASMVGATRESVNKALSTFRSLDLIKISGSSILVLDNGGLEKMLQERER